MNSSAPVRLSVLFKGSVQPANLHAIQLLLKSQSVLISIQENIDLLLETHYPACYGETMLLAPADGGAAHDAVSASCQRDDGLAVTSSVAGPRRAEQP